MVGLKQIHCTYRTEASERQYRRCYFEINGDYDLGGGPLDLKRAPKEAHGREGDEGEGNDLDLSRMAPR